MSNQGVMKEIRIDIQSELAMNIINYLIVEENYVYVGNERDIWLENLSHPTVQLIYINQRNLFNEHQATQFFNQVDAVRSRVRRRYLMGRLNVIILNLDQYSSRFLESHRKYLKIVHVNQPSDLKQDVELQQLFPHLKEAQLERSMIELIPLMQQATKEKAMKVKKMLMFQNKSFITYGFIVCLIAIFAFLQFKPINEWFAAVAIDYGAKYNPLILAGQYYRLITPAFLHLDLMHLLFNLVFIYQFGRMVEHVFGWWRMLVIIIGSAIFGNLCSYAFIDGLSIGASTVAYGLLGALLFLGIESRKMFMHFVRTLVLPILLFSVIWIFLEPNIDFSGHLGGFLGGFLIASITGLPKHKYYLSRTILAGATILVLLVGLFNRGAAITKQTDYTLYNRAMIAYYYQTDQLEKAEQFIETLQLDFNELFKK